MYARVAFDLRIHAASVYLYFVGVVTLAENLSSLRLHIELNNVVLLYMIIIEGPSRALGTHCAFLHSPHRLGHNPKTLRNGHKL